MNATYTIQTDSPQTIKLQSNIIYALWLSSAARAGGQARFEVRTSFVGEGATIEVTAYTESGKKLGKVKDKVTLNRFVGTVDIPEKTKAGEMVYFEAKLPKHGLKMESNLIPVKPHIQVKSLKWDKQEARRGDTLKLTADFQSGVEDNPDATVIIYEFNPDGHHFRVVSIPTQVQNNKIELLWEYEYHDDTAEIPTEEEKQKYNKHYVHPEYFFVVVIDDERIGTGQESGKLKFKDWVEIELVDGQGSPMPNERYEGVFADGNRQSGKLDGNGKATISSLPPGNFTIEFPDQQAIDASGQQ